LDNISQDRYYRILNSVKNPSSYLGTERNRVAKDPSTVKGSMVLAFPDLYGIGVAHLGLKILYHIINAEPDLAAERVFAPGEDFAESIRSEGMPLMSLETKKPLLNFDVIGFTIPYELSYTTILWMLDAAGVPLRSADRDESHPIVIGGGAGVYNPEPIADFFDLFVLGDGETAAVKILREVIAGKGTPRRATLEKLAKIDGVYVPSFFDVSYKASGGIERVTPILEGYDKVERTFLPTLSQSPFPVKMVVPFGRPVQDRLNVEIDRGCTQGCRFCQAGTTYRPVRERPPQEIMDIFDEALKNTGYDEISPTSLSAGDYSGIEPLLKALMDRYADEKISVSMPSLRPDTVTGPVVDQIRRVRRTGFTIAAEAGTDRLRAVINKKVTDEQIIETAKRLLASGWRSLKLYFMIGLPTETDEDIESIFELAARIDKIRVGVARLNNITVSVSNFVPKPHTPFQWSGQESIDNLVSKKEKLFGLVKPNKRIRLKWHDAYMSFLEAVFSRGDRRLSAVVERAYRMGRRLDAWTERFDYDKWIEAFEKQGLDPSGYANREYGIDETLPWDHLRTGISKKFLLKERSLAMDGVITQDCKTGECLGCGINPKMCFEPYDTPPGESAQKKTSAPEGRFKYRLTYHKSGPARFFSQLETQSIILRALRATRAPVRYSERYSPAPRVSFGPAIPVGVESAEEMMDVELAVYWEPWKISHKLNTSLPEGIRFVDARQISPSQGSITGATEAFDYRIRLDDPKDADRIKNAVIRFNESSCVVVPRRDKKVDIRPLVSGLDVEPESLDLVFKASYGPDGTVRPDDLLKGLFAGEDIRPLRVVRLKAHFKPGSGQ